MSKNLKREILELLESDREFRYAVAGYLGLSEILKRLDKLEENQNKLWENQNKLWEEVKSLRENQEKLWEEIKSLREGQNKLWEGQNKLWEEVRSLRETTNKLIESIHELSRAVNRLSDIVGFGLEDIARVVVPGWLYRHENILIEDLEGRFFFVDGLEVEVNLYGEGVREGKKVVILGEAKSRIFRSDVEKFYENVERLRKVIKDDIYPLMFAFYIHPTAQEEAKTRKITLIASYMK